MSSLKNIVKKRTYRERAQPSARQKFGLLEKHKDYKLRARDFHRKEEAIQKMRHKAAFKNPDEFYFNMNKSRMQDGVHRKADAPAPDADELRAFKRQDASYVQGKVVSESRKVRRLHETLHALDGLAAPKNKRTVFVNAAADVPAASAEASAEADGLDAQGEAPVSRKRAAKLERQRKAQHAELAQRTDRHAKLSRVLQRLEGERRMLGKGRRKKLKQKEGAPRQFKWRQERKR